MILSALSPPGGGWGKSCFVEMDCMTRYRPLLIVLALALIALSGCAGAKPATASAQAPQGQPSLGSKQLNGLTVTLLSSPARPIRGVGTLEAVLMNAQAQPVTDARVSFDIDMTNMSHGKYVVAATQTAQGRYAGQVRFMMPGPWRAIVAIERPGQQPLLVRFDFPVNFR